MTDPMGHDPSDPMPPHRTSAGGYVLTESERHQVEAWAEWNRRRIERMPPAPTLAILDDAPEDHAPPPERPTDTP